MEGTCKLHDGRRVPGRGHAVRKAARLCKRHYIARIRACRRAARARRVQGRARCCVGRLRALRRRGVGVGVGRFRYRAPRAMLVRVRQYCGRGQMPMRRHACRRMRRRGIGVGHGSGRSWRRSAGRRAMARRLRTNGRHRRRGQMRSALCTGRVPIDRHSEHRARIGRRNRRGRNAAAAIRRGGGTALRQRAFIEILCSIHGSRMRALAQLNGRRWRGRLHGRGIHATRRSGRRKWSAAPTAFIGSGAFHPTPFT